MYLVSPQTYVSVAQMRAFANDYDLTGYSDSELTSKLCAASARANSIMQRDLLAQERTIRYTGDGTNKLDLVKSFVLYVKRAQVINVGGAYAIPANELLIDYESGDALEFAPLYWAGAGYRAIFPWGAPLDITFAWGLGYTAAIAPAFAASDISGGGLTPGAYNLAVTARTFWGETSAIVKQFTTSTGRISITVTSGLGVYLYRLYASAASANTTTGSGVIAGAIVLPVVGSTTAFTVGSQWLLDTGVGTQEVVTVTGSPSGQNIPISATVYAHGSGVSVIPAPLLIAEMPVASFGALPITSQISSLSQQAGLFPDPIPTSDTSAPPIPWEITEAVRVLTMHGIFEDNNLANRGLRSKRSGDRATQWQSTLGNSGRGTSAMVDEAAALLNNYTYRGFA